jgi:DNA-binding response OmpR family regulator
MSLEPQQALKILKNRLVLIVEDDRELAGRIASLIKEYTGLDPKVANSVEAARNSVDAARQDFGLVIMDVMLPPLENNLTLIERLEERLESLRKRIKEAAARPNDEDMKSNLFKARDERAHVLDQIDALIDAEKGFELVSKWRQTGHTFPILFLTAVGADDIVKQGKEAAGERSDWIVKPVSSELILEKCVDLLKMA